MGPFELSVPRKRLLRLVLCAAGCTVLAAAASATELVMKDGRTLTGKEARVASLADMPAAARTDGSGPLQLIVLLDDDLRRTFVSKRQLQDVRQENAAQLEEKVKIRQRVLSMGQRVVVVGPVIHVEPFDEFGRRTFTYGTVKGKIDVIQGITEITPQWTKVESSSHVWDMRIATSSIPRDQLHKILLKQLKDPSDIEQLKKIARFYLQCERYEEARAQLEGIAKAFPDRTDLRAELEPSIRSIRQLESQRLLTELKLRREAGQHQLVVSMLRAFPSADVAGEILQAVHEMSEEYRTQEARRAEVLQQFDVLLAKIADTALRARIAAVRNEIAAELDISTLDRMAAFRQNLEDQDMPPADKLALGVSGWLLGSDAAMVKLSAALSAYKVRDQVKQYLNQPGKIDREQLFGTLSSEEGATAGLVAGLIAHMKPAAETPDPADPKRPGFYRLEVVGLAKEPPVPYLVQLPPEYNPYRRYPTVVALNGAGLSPEQEVDWWAGPWSERGSRFGQASRHGYIVIAPQWSADHQKQYNYSAREHAAVLACLRDACRRFAVDTDRVFLSGHFMGGDAAWDLGLAHPDLWAGVIPIVAQADRYCALYWENAKYVPFYVVCGELDGGKLTKDARDLDRYLTRGFNATVVEFRGRGYEDFSDEILRLFDWMGRCRRNFFPRDFACVTMRTWDNFFWWVELGGLPRKSVVDPADWPQPRGTQPMQVSGKLLDNNGLSLRTGSSQMTVCLSPEMLNLEQRVSITVNGRPVNSKDRYVQPDVRTILEDVRARSDRQHPFWAKLDVPTGRVAQ